MIIGTLISLWLWGTKIGEDEYGNKYYIMKSTNAEGKNKRVILYKGLAEPSKIPPLWHAWLHYTSDTIPANATNYTWQKQRTVNLTGTDHAYRPDGHVTKGFKRAKTSADYSAWSGE